MNLCIDQGNSSCKLGIFDNNILIDSFTFKTINFDDIYTLLNKYEIDACIISSVISNNCELKKFLTDKINFIIELSSITPIPITNRYETPDNSITTSFKPRLQPVRSLRDGSGGRVEVSNRRRRPGHGPKMV